MSIILRTVKGTALTYDEMDRNLSQYFYSSSIHTQGTKLRLHYTGSDSLDTGTEDYGPTRYHEININGNGGSTLVAGVSKIIAGTNVTISPTTGLGTVTINAQTGGTTSLPGGTSNSTTHGSVQYKIDSTTFGGDTSYYYDYSNKYLGLGTQTPSAALNIVGNQNRQPQLKVQTDGTTSTTADVTFFDGTTKLGSIGKVKDTGKSNKDIFITADRSDPLVPTTYNKIHSEINDNVIHTVSQDGVGIKTQVPNQDLTIITDSNEKGIGIGQNETTLQNRIRPITTGIINNLFDGLQVSDHGILIHPSQQSTNGGNIVLGVLDTNASLNFDGSASTRPNRVSIAAFKSEGSLNENLPIATFESNRTVGINTNTPSAKVKLDINGQYRGSFLTQSDNYSLNFIDYSAIQVNVNTTATTEVTLTEVPPAGVKATLILNAVETATLTFASSSFITAGALTATKDFYYTISFISNGTHMIEISRAAGLDN